MRVGDTIRYTGQDGRLRGKTGKLMRADNEYIALFDDKPWNLPRGTFVTVVEGVDTMEREYIPPPRKPTKPALPLDSTERKRWPLFAGLLRYFPSALAQVSNHSYLGNEKHNPGQPLNHARGKSTDHEDCVLRHLMDASEHPAGSAARIDELRGVAWRALALLQEECELAGYRVAPAATFNKDK